MSNFTVITENGQTFEVEERDSGQSVIYCDGNQPYAREVDGRIEKDDIEIGENFKFYFKTLTSSKSICYESRTPVTAIK